MTESMSIHEFRSHLAEALGKVEHGRTVVVTKHGRPIAEIRPPEKLWGRLSVRPAKRPHHRKPRMFKGTGTMSREIIEERRRDG